MMEDFFRRMRHRSKVLGFRYVFFSCLLLSCDKQESPIEIPLSPCQKCQGVRTETLNLLVENVFDTLIFRVLDDTFQFADIEPEHYGVCQVEEDMLQTFIHGSIITATAIVHDQCEEGAFLEFEEFTRIIHCHPEVDTVDIQSGFYGSWRIQRFNELLVPCEQEDLYLGIIQGTESDPPNLNVMGMMASIMVRDDTINLYDHVVLLYLEPTENGQFYRGQLSDFFGSGNPDTTRIQYQFHDNFLIFRNPVTGDSLITYQ